MRDQLAIRALPGTAQKINEIVPKQIGRGYLLEAYPTLHCQTLTGLRGKFDGAELRTLIEIGGNTYLSPDMAGRQLPAQLTDAGEAALAAKVQSLTAFEIHTLELWARNSPEGELAGYIARFLD